MVTDMATTPVEVDLVVTMEMATTQEETIILVGDLMAVLVDTVHLVLEACTITVLTTAL